MFLICGEALYDFFLSGEGASGNLGFDARPGGSPFNVAIGIQRLGGSAALLTGLSDDMLGARLSSVLEAEQVDTDYLVRTGRRTTLSLVGMDEAGGPSYAFYGVGSADCSLTETDLPAIGPEIDGLHFGSYSIAVNPVADTFAALAQQQAGRFISFDPNVRPTIEPNMDVWRARIDMMLDVADLVKVSDEDIAALFPDTDPIDVIRDWSSRNPAMVVLTRGGAEAVAIRGDDHVLCHPKPVDVINTVGAGDTFMAALLTLVSTQQAPARYLAEMGGDDIKAMLRFASTAAGITCTRIGADLPRREEVDAMLSGGTQ